METRDTLDSKSAKILPLHSRPNFNWIEWKAYLFIFAMTVALGTEVLTMDCSILVETPAAKIARIAKYASANAAIIFVICQSAFLCEEGRAIACAHQLSEFKGNAFVLLRLLEERFTLKKTQTLAKLLIELNALACIAHETPATLLDRYNKIVLGIMAIDLTQLPTELQLITILKNAISVKFKLLHVVLSTISNLTLVVLKEKFQNWELKFEIELGAEGAKRDVANFAGNQSFGKKAKPGRGGKDKDQKLCFNCGSPDHFKRDCPQPDQSESNFGRKRNAGSAYGPGDGGGANNKFKQSRRENKGQSQNNHFGKKIDGKIIKSIMRKPAGAKPSGGEWPRKSGNFINAEQDDRANMMEEIIVDNLEGAGVPNAFQASVARHSRMICIDSGCNIFILRFILTMFENFRVVVNRVIRTAAAAGVLRVEALFDSGHASDIRHCPDASANLMPTNVIVRMYCAVIFDMLSGVPRCRIVANESSHGGDENNFFEINCVMDNELWWISEQQMLDIIHRNGFPLAEAQRIAAGARILDYGLLAASTDFDARDFMDRPDTDSDWEKVVRFVRVQEHQNQYSGRLSHVSHKDRIFMFKEECYEQSPYGKRLAVHSLNSCPE